MTLRIVTAKVTLDPKRVRGIMHAALQRGVFAAATTYVGAIKRSLGGRAGSAAGSPPGSRTGDLRRSITASEPPHLTSIVGANKRYAAMQEFGGVIKPKKGKYLKVPMGVSLRAKTLTFRDTGNEDVTLIPLRGGRFMGVRKIRGKSGKGDRDDILFMLVRKVTIQARPYLRPAMRSRVLAKQARDVMMQTVRKQFKAGFAKYLGET